MVEIISVKTQGQGLYEITDKVRQLLMTSGVKEGLCSLLIQHTSASLTIQENADPSAQHDLENWLNRLVPEGDTIYMETVDHRPNCIPEHKTGRTP
jgi:secondary thiamine-phosphate synthase enzyme